MPDTIDLAGVQPDLTIRGWDAGDLDGDGKDDLIVGAPKGSGPGNVGVRSGEVCMVHSRTLASLGSEIDLSIKVFRDSTLIVYGADDGDEAASAVAVGRLDSDIAMDLLVGAPGSSGRDNTRVGAGETHIVTGRVGGMYGEMDLRELLQVVVWGAENGDKSGSTVACGDYDGDGLDDVIVGAYEADGLANGRNNCGKT